MTELVNHLKELGFSGYEAQALLTLVKYHSLTAKDLSRYSGIPRPKVYETMARLEERGFVDSIPQANEKAKVYRILSKSGLKAKISAIVAQYTAIAQTLTTEIDETYDTRKRERIPLIGIAGDEHIADHFLDMIETTEEYFIAGFPPKYFTDQIIAQINAIPPGVRVDLIFHDKTELESVQSLCPRARFFHLETPAFRKIHEMVQNIGDFLPEQRESYTYKTFLKVTKDLAAMFGLVLQDGKKSLFIIPLPIPVSVAIVSTMPEIVTFHNEGAEAILASCRLVDPPESQERQRPI